MPKPRKRKRKSYRHENPLDLGMRAFPYSMRREIERENARAERIERGALAAVEMMTECDRKRFRVEPNSDYILKLKAAYRQAQRDLKFRLPNPPLQEPKGAGYNVLGVWDLIFELAWLAPTPRHAKIWGMILLHNQSLRARGKGEKTTPEVKALLDFLTEHRLLCYDKKRRFYTSAPRYEEALNLMREIETGMLNELFRLRQPIRDR